MANGKYLKRPLLKHEILEAQENSRSASQAAKYLDVDFATYKKYAQFYGIYENLLNQKGVGIAKGYSKSQPHSTKLKDIFNNEHPDYPLQRLKWRMVARDLIEDRCYLCGFDEGRITDDKKPIIMVFKDEDGDYSISNLINLCYNCCFLTKGAPTVVNWKHIKSSVEGKTSGSGRPANDPMKNPTGLGMPSEDDLTDEEIAELKREIDRELGRF